MTASDYPSYDARMEAAGGGDGWTFHDMHPDLPDDGDQDAASTMPGAASTVGPSRPLSGKSTTCCGDPTNLDGGAHPWMLASEDGPGDVYRCPECGAVDGD